MTLHDIISAYLREHGYDGLCLPWQDCGCGIDKLFPCDSPTEDCQPAYRRECEKCPEDGKCELTQGFESLYLHGCWHSERLEGK